MLDRLLSDREFIVDNEFSVADVAVASYLNYVPVFFGGAIRKLPSSRANLGKYMIRCAQRPAFAKAFGKDHTDLILQKVPTWIA
jgi:glutathione S-transferase